MNEKCCVIVNTCDAYVDLWKPFFTLFARNWPDCPYEVILNTEQQDYEFNGIALSVNKAKRIDEPWGARLYECVKKVKTPYVLFLLDDFFLEGPVNQKKIEQCLCWMENNPEIASFSLVPTLWEDIADNRFPGFLRRPDKCLYKVNCQAGIWRKEMLVHLIRKHETPWEFENFGSSRARRQKQMVFYAADESSSPVFQYDWVAGGAVHRGKWTERVPSIAKQNGLVIDFTQRGMDEVPVTNHEKRANPEEHVPLLVKIGNAILHWRSYL